MWKQIVYESFKKKIIRVIITYLFVKTINWGEL